MIGSGHGDDGGRREEPASGAPLFSFDDEHRIVSWNKAAERLTGHPAAEVVGKRCWEVLCFHDEAGAMVCHKACSFHRLLRERWLVKPPTLLVRTTEGPKRMTVPMVVLQDRQLFAALMLEAGSAEAAVPTPDEEGRMPVLTQRQRLVLAMLAEGKPARAIALELRLSELTVRNHIRAVLRELSCTSQLTAVAKARRLGLV